MTVKIVDYLGGTVEQETFPNGYGISIARHGHARGGCEVAVLHEDQLCYSTPVTDDVIGYCSDDDVVDLRTLIRYLESDDGCTHD